MDIQVRAKAKESNAIEKENKTTAKQDIAKFRARGIRVMQCVCLRLLFRSKRERREESRDIAARRIR